MLGNIAGGVLGAVGGYLGQKQAQRFNAKEAAKNIEFQERMSRNAHQYAAEDMEKAGLNRILALGNQASTPSGDSASTAPTDYGTIGSNAASAVAARRNMKAQNENLEAQNELIKAEVLQKNAQTRKTELESAFLAPIGSGLQQIQGEIDNVWGTLRKEGLKLWDGEFDRLNSILNYFKEKFNKKSVSSGKNAGSLQKELKQIKENPQKFLKQTDKSIPQKIKEHFKKRSNQLQRTPGKDWFYDKKDTLNIKIRGK